MPARARVAHHVPGRIRIKIRGAKHNTSLLNEIKQSLLPLDGVRSVDVHPITSSLVIHYGGRKPKEFRESVSHRGNASGLFNLPPPEIGEGGEMYKALQEEAELLAAHSRLARSVVDEAKRLDNAVKRATDNELDLKVVVPLGLAIYSAVEFGAEIATPLWVTLGIFAFNSFVALHTPLPYPETAAEGTPRSVDAR
jgi:copper chaperone CopZ